MTHQEADRLNHIVKVATDEIADLADMGGSFPFSVRQLIGDAVKQALKPYTDAPPARTS